MVNCIVDPSSGNLENRESFDTIALFDVDGTLSLSRKLATPEMMDLLKELKKKVVIGFVGGSDLSKQLEQLGPNAIDFFDFSFAENGAIAYKHGKTIGKESLIGFLGEKNYKELVNFVLGYIADLDIPVKR